MDKENNRSAAGLRRSAMAERIRLREEWSELKGIVNEPKPHNILNKKSQNIRHDAVKKAAKATLKNKQPIPYPITSDVLHGVVALVEVGTEGRALALRAALNALGATVVPTWSPLVTHLVWAQGGCRSTRAKARALASRLVSPLWVEACAASNRHLSENTFPAAARASDLPSPKTLRRLLKQAERENVPLVDLLTDSKEDGKATNNLRLRMSSETDQDTSHDKSADTSHDKSDTTISSRDTSNDTIDVVSRVNTAPRRALPMSITPPPPKKSRRKLFTQKEAEDESRGESSEDEITLRRAAKLTQQDKKALARAERMARRLAANTPAKKPRPLVSPTTIKPRIVLTGMSRIERHTVCNAIRELGGRIQSYVNKKTTHVLLGSCKEDSSENANTTNLPTKTCNITEVANLKNQIYNVNQLPCTTILSGMKSVIPNSLASTGDIKKARTLNALLGAARGCRVLHAQWVLDSFEAKKWLHHNGYEVQHLKKISQKARVERKAFCHMRSEYAYDVFSGMRVRLSTDVEQKDAAKQLLTLCGAVLIEGNQNGGFTQNGGRLQNGGLTQNGGRSQNGGQDHDIVIGMKEGEISSKWVFDSVAAARMRTTRRYVNQHSNDDLIEQFLRSMST